MKNQERANKYNKLMNIIYGISYGCTEINYNERELISDINDYIMMDRNNKVIKYVINNNEELNSVINKINKLIDEYSLNNDSEELNKLIILKNDVNQFIESQYGTNNIYTSRIIDKSVNSIVRDSFSIPSFFNEKFASINYHFNDNHFVINENLIHKLYDLFENNSYYYDEICEGVSINESIKKYESIVNKCVFAFSHQDKLYSNIDDLIEYNLITKDLNNMYSKANQVAYKDINKEINKINTKINELKTSKLKKSIYKRKIKELEIEKNKLFDILVDRDFNEKNLAKMKDRFEVLSDKLREVGLYNLVNNDKKDNSLLNDIKTIYSKEDLDNFYINIIREYGNNKLLLEDTRIKENEFYDKVSDEAFKLMNDDYCTAYNINKLSEKNNIENIDPRLAIYVLETLLVSRDTNIEDMDISEDEYKCLDNYFSKIINKKVDSYNNRIDEITNKGVVKVKR